MPTIRQSQNISAVEEGISPRVRRWGLMPPMFVCEMEPRESGQSERAIPTGEMVLFETAERMEQNFNINDLDFVFAEKKERSAKWYMDNVKKQYAAFGFVELDMLTPLEDDVAQAYFDAIHPTFRSINHSCPESLTNCATCRIAMLESQSFSGTQEDLRLRALQSYVAYHGQANERWSALVGEREDRKNGRPGIAKFGEAEHHLRRNLHAVDPDFAAANAAKGYGDASAEGMRAIGGSIGDAVSQLAANQAAAEERAAAAEQRHSEQMAAMMQLIANNGGAFTTSNSAISTTEAEQKVDKRTREYKESLNAQRAAEGGNEDIS